ncbi:MAG: potassium channel protein [candidate division Zixibacteria bacterium]|nr:potassium channel protein [candidate division Zixibacteria bacterium]
MKFLPSQILYFTRSRTTKQNVRLLLKFLTLLSVLVLVYSVLFHFIMLHEAREYSWITGLYWTLTVMSTLGFGDITFVSDLGKAFSLVVLLSGILFLLVMLPFTFIQFFYAPWLEAQSRAKTPRELPATTSGHIILTSFDSLTVNLVHKLAKYNYEYAIVAPDLKRARELYEMDMKVVVGELGDAETYRRLRIENAAMLVANNEDTLNTNIAFTVREITKDIPIITNAESDDSIDILELAGSSYVFQFMKMLGESLARRTLGMSIGANVIGRFDQLIIAEASAMRTLLEGKTLVESGIRAKTGATVVGLWKRGEFRVPLPESRIDSTTVLVLAGSLEQLENFEKVYYAQDTRPATEALVLILGGGRVGLAASNALKQRGIPFRIVEKNPKFIRDENYIEGDAADIHTLYEAGIREATSVIVTTHDDSVNVYLTIYCRKLRSDVQIISRANLDHNISKLHSAGADLVMSHASIGANTIINLLLPNRIMMVAEGLNVFRLPVHKSFAGKSLAEVPIRHQTGCSVIAISKDGDLRINPGPSVILDADDEMVLIGSGDAEKRLMEIYR